MKRFLKKVIIYFLVTATLCFVPSMIVDPFNVFHPMHVRDAGVEPNRNYTKTYNATHNPGKWDSFITGSSHCFVYNVTKFPETCFNLSYSGGIPADHLGTLKSLIRAGIVPEKYYVTVDNGSFWSNYDEHSTQNLRAQYDYSKEHPLKFWMLYLDPVVNIVRASNTIRENKATFAPWGEEYYEYGSGFVYDNIDPNAATQANEATHASYNEMLTYLENIAEYPEDCENYDEVISSMKEIKRLCDRNGIELIVVINPIYYDQFREAVMENAFLSFLRDLAEITPYYNFSGFNKYTIRDEYYGGDKQHFVCDLADLALNCFCYGEVDEEAYSQGFGVYVTPDNVEKLISVITDPAAAW